MKPWIKDLMDEYPTNRSDVSIDRLERIFEQYDDKTMSQATDLYILAGKYFPKVADMKKYVDHALYAVKQQGPTEYEKVLQMDDDEIEELDARMLAWEQERGTMGAA